jgi:hypothetical protein
MEWVPEDMWLTYLRVNTPAENLDYDLAVSTHDGVLPSARMVGIGMDGGPTSDSATIGDSGFPMWDVVGIVVGVLVVLTVVVVARSRSKQVAS